jgi:Domain of unknown function (DUF4157)
VKQGVQLVIERVQRHRAFPRLASANGQNLPATLSPANIPTPLGSRLEQPRFVPVLAEPTTPSVSSLQNVAFDLEAQDEISVVAENTSLEFEPSFQTFANDATQVDEQFSEQIFEQTLALKTSQRFESTEIVEPKTSSANITPEITNESASTINANVARVAQQPEISNNQPIAQAKNPQDSGVPTRASQTNQNANQQPISETAQPRETPLLTGSPKQENSSAQTSQSSEFATPTLSSNLEQNNSFSEPNQNQDTTLIAEEIPVSALNIFLETPDLIPTGSIQTENASDESLLDATQIEPSAQVVRPPSRFESTLEALRQFNPPTPNNEPIADSQPTQANARATKTSGALPSKAVSKAQPRAIDPQKAVEPKLTKLPSESENQKSLEPQVVPSAKPQLEANNQNSSTIQTTLETQAVTRATPALPTEPVHTQNLGAEAIQTESAQTKPLATEILQTDLSSSATERADSQNQINLSEGNQFEPPRSETVSARTNSLQPQTLSVASTQTQIPEVNPTQPELQTKTSSLETPSNQRPNEDTRENTQASSELAVSSTQAPLSEEARERAAYQRSVTMRAERAKRALAAKEELERDPTLELETNETPATRLNEPQLATGSDLKPPLEQPPQIKVMPSIEAEPNLNPQTQNPETSASSQTMIPDLEAATVSNSSDQSVNNIAPVKLIVTPSTTEPLIEIYSENPRELQPTNSSEVQSENPIKLQPDNSSEAQLPNLSETQTSNVNQSLSELQTPNSSEIQTLNSDQAPTNSDEVRAVDSSETQMPDLNQSSVQDMAEIQSNQNSNQIQNSNLVEIPSQNQISDSIQTATQNPSQTARPNQDLPVSFLSKTEGVSVYNPQRRIQRAAPTPPPKPKHEPNEAEKLFAQSSGMSQQDVLDVIRKAQGLPPIPTTSQVQNPIQENILTPQNAQSTNNLNQETSQPTEQDIESNTSLTTTSLSQTNQDARVEQTQEYANPATSSVNVDRSFDGREPKTQTSTTLPAQARSVIVDSHGSKIHVFNPPNRRVLPPKPKVEVQKTEAQKLFETMEVTETADELFQRVVKNRLKPNANLEPQEHQDSNLNLETTVSSLEASTPSSSQTLLPNLPNRNFLNSSDQPASTSFTGNERVQLGGSERVQLSQNATRFLKPIVGIDPNDVKIYRDPQSERLTKAARADALTFGDTVLLSSEQPLESPETLGLIAHELTHVARNRQARFVPPVARANNNLAASAQSGNEEGLALGVEAFARQGWNNFNQNTPTQNLRSQTTPSNTDANRSSYGGLPAPADLPQWFIEDRVPPQAASQPAPRAAEVVRSAPESTPFMPQAPTNPMAASMGAQAASQGRDVPTPPPAAGPLPASQQPKPEPIPNRAAPDLDAMARQVYTILKRRLANERHRM